MTFFRTVLFLPQVLAMVVVGGRLALDLAPDGVLNETLRRSVSTGSPAPGSATSTWALPAVGVVGTWVGTGLCMVLFLAGVQSIPRELYEAARLDGAGPLREFLAVTLPGAARRRSRWPDPDDRRGAAQLRPDLHHHRRRPR